jgi:hypothetical protein
MPVFSSINVKSSFISLISNTVSYLGAVHHITALHEVEHDVFKSGYKCLLVYQIEINFIISNNLDSYISFDVVNKSSCLNLIITFPVSFIGIFVKFHFEEINRTRTSANQCFIVNKIHLAKIHVRHSFIGIFRSVATIYNESLPLSIEGINFIFVRIIKASVREVFFCAFKNFLLNTTNY